MQEIDPQFFGQARLFKGIHPFHRAAAPEKGAGILEPKGHVCFYALLADGKHPVVIAFTGVAACFAAHGNMLCPMKIGRQVDRLQKRRAGDKAPLDRVGQKQREPVIGQFLGFDGTAKIHIAVPIAPIGGKRYGEPVDPFGEDQKLDVLPFPDKGPGFPAPLVRFGKKKVGCKTGGKDFVSFDVVFAFCVFSDGPIELLGFLDRILAEALGVRPVK